MTNEERKIRMQTALEIMNGVYSDCCHGSREDMSREDVREFCYFIIEARKFIEAMFNKTKGGIVIPFAFETGTKLSYIDLIFKLKEGIETENIPEAELTQINEHLNALHELLQKYSA